MIGAVGTIFGKHGVNIAQMSVGRRSETPGGEAIGVLNLDSPPPPQAMEEVLAKQGVRQRESVRVAGRRPAAVVAAVA